tara:strand:- start:1138 stop:1737 length:600 start_codon:yes stop_codon:yes gene_type:complete
MDIKTKVHNSEDFLAVAKLHCGYINKGFLATLGVPFLALLYEAIDNDKESFLIVERFENKIIGFVCGTSGLKKIYFQLLFRPIRLISSLKSSIFSLSKIYKIFEIFKVSKNYTYSKKLPNEELLSIVVDPSHQGDGHAETLFNALCLRFKENEKKSFKIIVGSNLDRAHSFYTKMGAAPISRVQVHKGKDSIIYLKKLA